MANTEAPAQPKANGWQDEQLRTLERLVDKTKDCERLSLAKEIVIENIRRQSFLPNTTNDSVSRLVDAAAKYLQGVIEAP